MTRDEWVVAAVVSSFATLATTHVTLVVGLWSRPRPWRAAVAAVVAPLAPYWGLRSRMPARAALWLASAIAYAVARILARR